MFDKSEKAPLTELADITMGQSPDSSSYNDEGIGVPFYQGKTEFTDVYVTVNKYCSKPKKMAKAMDILMSVRAPVGAVNLTSQECCIGRGLAAITPKEGVTDVWFLFNALKTMEQQISDMGVGSTFTAIGKDDMKKIKIPVAPIALQNEFSQFVQQVDKSKVILSTITKSRFIEMFGTSANPKYGQVKIAELVSKDIEKVPKKYNSDDIIEYIDISSIDKESRLIVDTAKYAVKDAPSRAQQCVIEGDILLSNVRPNLKTLAIVNSKKNNLVCSTGFTVLRCTDSCPEYLTIAITDDYFTNKLVKKANGSNYPAVTSKDVYNSVIPSAPIELQKQFATFVQQIDKSKVTV